MLIWFRYGVILSAVVCLSLLIYLIFKTFSFVTPKLNAPPSGSRKKGIFFAFGRGMMPWEKESAKKHLLTYGAGIIYHTGIFAAFLYLFLDLFSVKTSVYFDRIFLVIIASALLCGLGLLFKRSLLKYMRAISTPDDFVSNILVDLFLILSLFKGVPLLSLYISIPFLLASLFTVAGMLKKKYRNPKALTMLCGLTILINIGISLSYLIGFAAKGMA